MSQYILKTECMQVVLSDPIRVTDRDTGVFLLDELLEMLGLVYPLILSK